MLRYDKQRVLILSPHADDETLGCGGVIQKYIAHQSPVRIVVASFVIDEYKRFKKEINAYVSYSGKMRFKEMQSAFATLGVHDYDVLYMENSANIRYHGMLDTRPKIELVTAVEKYIRDFQPTVVFIPSRTKHQDHTVLHDVAITATRPYYWHGSVIVYETDGEVDFDPNLYVPLTESEVNRKRAALNAYQTQVSTKEHPVSPDAITVKARFRGQDVYESYAEAFQVLRIYG